MKSPFEIITAWEISELVNKKWEPFRVYPINKNTIDDVIKSNPERKVLQCNSFGNDNWIVFYPDNYENDKCDHETKESYREVFSYLNDLSRLSEMQIDLSKIDINENVPPGLIQKIEVLYNDLFSKQIKETNDHPTLTSKQAALYYYYLQEANEIKRFDESGNKMAAEYQEAANKFGIKSGKHFSTKLSHCTGENFRTGDAEQKAKGNIEAIKNLNIVIELLSKEGKKKALNIAKEELKKAKENKSST